MFDCFVIWLGKAGSLSVLLVSLNPAVQLGDTPELGFLYLGRLLKSIPQRPHRRAVIGAQAFKFVHRPKNPFYLPGKLVFIKMVFLIGVPDLLADPAPKSQGAIDVPSIGFDV